MEVSARTTSILAHFFQTEKKHMVPVVLGQASRAPSSHLLICSFCGSSAVWKFFSTLSYLCVALSFLPPPHLKIFLSLLIPPPPTVHFGVV